MIYLLGLLNGWCLRSTKIFFNKDCRSISKRTAKCDVMKKYEIEKENLKQQLNQIPSRVSLTSDS